MKYSPWFPPRIKPVHAGPYDTTVYFIQDVPEYLLRAHWNGKRWMFDGNGVVALPNQRVYWRGLSRKP